MSSIIHSLPSLLRHCRHSLLWQRQPWYSLEYQDVIKDTSLSPYGNLDSAEIIAQHVTGQKQYELTDHLGDVLMTVSDARQFPQCDTIPYYLAVVQSENDYYPFGMLMPGRYKTDSFTHCTEMTITEDVAVHHACLRTLPDGLATPIGTAVLSVGPTPLVLTCNAPGDGFSYVLPATPGMPQTVSIVVVGPAPTGSFTANIGTTTVPIGIFMPNSITFTATTTTVTLQITGFPTGIMPFSISINAIKWDSITFEPQTVIAKVCDEDKYEYGYNGQMKVNEWAGVGNHTTALYWEYDTRTGRRDNLEPKKELVPMLSPYCVLNNNSISFKDPNGDFFVVDDAIIGFAKGLLAKKSNFDDGVSSRIGNAFHRAGRQAANSAKIYGGLFTADKDKSFLGKVKQIVSRFTYELPQTAVGLLVQQGGNTLFNMKSVSYSHGATFAQFNKDRANGSFWAFTFGSFISGSKSSDKLFEHEYGHYMQSQTWGLLYLPVIAVPSGINAATHSYAEHDNAWYERDASKKGRKHFGHANEYESDFDGE